MRGWSAVVIMAGVGIGCVPQAKYDQAAQDAQSARGQAQACDAQLAAAHGEAANLNVSLAKLNDSLASAQALADQRDKALAQALSAGKDMQAKLDEATAENAQLRKELERLGKNADKLLSEKGTLAAALDQARARLEELRRAQGAADARAALFRELAAKFQRMIDAGELKIALRDGRMVLQLANDVLFDSGQTEIKAGGLKALQQVAAVLRTIGGRRFQVAGDTDNVPIQTPRFASNWELSTQRAVVVTRYLIAQGVRPDVLSAAGYGEFDPIASNADATGRAKNRRIEISLQPNIDELVALPKP